ncbi:hypothetical protein Tco_1406779 [Tanacetum coccineum]
MWARRCRSGKSPGNISPSSFSVQLMPGDMSPGKPIPNDKSPEIPRICRWGKCCKGANNPLFFPCYEDFENGIYWNDDIHWIDREWGRYLHYKLEFMNKTIVLATIQLPVSVTVKKKCKLFESLGCLLLIGMKKKRLPYDQLNVYEMRKGDSE